MKDMVRRAGIVAISMLVVANATAQQASAPAKPATASDTAATPAAAAPNVATVSDTNGKAMLNHGSVYEVVKKNQRLQVGDRVVVLDGGVASVQFDGGCVVTIDTAQVYTVPAAPPCAPGAAERGMRAPAPAAGTGAVATAESSQYLKWGLVALGVATPLLLLSNSNQGSPISP
jgi:hypothetical protein